MKLVKLLFAFVFVSCTSNSYYLPDKLVEIDRPIPTDTLKSETIHLGIQNDTSDYYVCVGAICVGPYLVQQTTSNKHYIRMVDLRNPDKAVLFGSQGHAGDEFVIIPQMFNSEVAANGDLLFYCTDSGKSCVVCVDAEASFREEKCIVRKTYKFFAKAGFNTFFPFYKSDSENIIAGYQEMTYIDARDDIYDTPKFYFYGQSGEIEKNVYPKGIVNSNHVIVTHVYQSVVNISPDRNKIVESLLKSDVTNIWDIESGKVIGIVGKDEPDFELYEKTSDGKYYSEIKKLYTGDVALSNDKIFRTSLRGLTNAEYSSDSQVNLPSLEVYNYFGELLGSFVLEQEWLSIAYSEYFDCLFSQGPENTIYKYELPQWLKKN